MSNPMVKIQGFDTIADIAKGLKSSSFMTALKGSMRKAAKPVISAVKSAFKVPGKQSWGATKKSVNDRVKGYAKTQTVVGMVGAQSSYRMANSGGKKVRVRPNYSKTIGGKTVSIAAGLKAYREAGGSVDVHQPSRYAHLLEKGHRLVKGGSTGRWIVRHTKKGDTRKWLPAKGSPHVVGSVKPYPYVIPGAKASRSQYEAILGNELVNRVHEQAAKAQAKNKQWVSP